MNFSENELLNTLVEMARAGERLGIVTDVDGTISPLAATPDAAQVTPKSRALLRQLRQQVALVAAVSGRAADDVSARVNLPELVYVGNHGLERWVDGRVVALPEAEACRPALDAVLATLKPHLQAGMIVEDKRETVAIHYRATPDPAAAYQTLAPIIHEASHAQGLKTMEGKMVFEVMPNLDVDKGHAFARLVTDYGLDAALYLGDDVTDAAALLKARELRAHGMCYALAVGVEADETPKLVQDNADLLVAGVSGVEALLEWLSHALSASST